MAREFLTLTFVNIRLAGFFYFYFYLKKKGVTRLLMNPENMKIE
jgi:hypothetical protein